MARNVRRHLRDEWFLAAAGCGSVIFGSILLSGWVKDDHILLVWLAGYALFSAIAMAGFAYRLRKARALAQSLAHDVLKQSAAATSK
jgi:uncharacterized membrane protein HdeD (DUF308 family)